MDEIKVVGDGSTTPDETKQETSIECIKNTTSNVGDIDTAAPFESVKDAVSRFGRIVHWKAHQVQTTEKRVYAEQRHEKTDDDDAAQEAKLQKELHSTKRLIEALKLNLERAETKEHEAIQDSQQHAAAVAELAAVNSELQNLREDYDILVSEKNVAVKRAREAASALKDVEKEVETLTIQLVVTKEYLELAQDARLEAEERRIGAAIAREQDALNWEQELKQAQEELEKANQQIHSIENKKSKLDTATALLRELKTEAATYKESKKNVEEVKQNVTKAAEEIGYLKTAAGLLKTELERETTALAAVRQREAMAEVAVASLEAELNRTISEIAIVQSKEKEARERMVELSRRLQKAAQEAGRAKSRAQEAREELKKVKESRLLAAQKELEAAKGAEKLTLAVIDTLQGPETEPEPGVTLSLGEYCELSKKARDAEEAAHTRVAEAVALIDVAKESELKRLSKLEQVSSELAARKQAFEAALQRAEKAKQGKLGAEQDLRKWRTEHGQRRKAGPEVKSFNVRPTKSLNQNSRPVVRTVIPESNSNAADSSLEMRGLKKKKGPFSPRSFMLLRKKKT